MQKILAIAALCAAIIPAAHAAAAQQPSPWSIDVNTTSYHTEAWARRQLNQNNPGLGIEYQAAGNVTWMAGFYRNSYRRQTVYGLIAWTPLRVDLPFGAHADAGIAAGLVSGYRRSEVPSAPLAAGAVLRLRTAQGYGVNLLAVPNTQGGSGFVGVQAVFPLN